ncbi:MAG: serine hydrolase [Saprospiraceae bacterium]|nr:serine hydrolase [Saprospiraceae bacterium]
MRFLIAPLCFLLILWSRPVISQDTREDFSEAITLIDLWLDAQRFYDNLPGLSVAVIQDQELLWSKGYGYADLANKEPASASTKYSICSISKLFTAVAIMHLYDAGKLRLDDKVEDLLPWFNIKQQFADSGPITVRSLLTHSSGLPRESNHPYWTGPDFPFPDKAMVKSGLDAQETLYPASTYFQYSNLGLTLLGEIVTQVSGTSYSEYVNKYILDPLKMHSTETFMPESEWGGKLAIGYGSAKRDGQREQVALFDAKGITAAAGFSSTVEDLGKFASWQFRLMANGGTEILQASTLKYMQQVHWIDPDWKTSWGLGFAVWEENGKSVMGHGGSCPGYRSTIMIDPAKKKAVIVMVNASGVNPSRYVNGIKEALAKCKTGEAEMQDVDLTAYTGFYNAQPWWSEEVIIPWQGKLASISLPNENPAKGMTLLEQVEADLFKRQRKDETLGEEIRFERNSEGKVIKYWQHNNFSNKIAPLNR